MSDLPIVMTEAGPLPQTPDVLRQQLVTLVAGTNPGYTANLPGTLIEDITSTDVGALIVCDQSAVDAVNSVTPFGANEFILNQMGQVAGLIQGTPTNTSVNVIFSVTDNDGNPLAGQVIQVGFIVSDGTYQYVVQDGGITQSGGSTQPLYCIASQAGSWAVPSNSVTQIVTSVPSGLNIACTNPLAGTPSAGAESNDSWRARVVSAGLAASQGMASYLKTLLLNIPGVQANLVSVRQPATGGYEVIVGGGDQYLIAYAIFQAVFDLSSLVGSVMAVDAITQAEPGVVTTILNHGLVTGQTATITGIVGMTELNGVALTVTVVDEKNFSIGLNTTSYPAYVSGGIVSPNPRNVVVTIDDYPDTYAIPFVLPPQQTVAVTATWNTTEPNFVGQAAVSALAVPAIASYINAIYVGQPINLNQMAEAFTAAITSVLTPALLTRLVFAVSINGIPTSPVSGSVIIEGDPESYFYATAASVTVIQG